MQQNSEHFLLTKRFEQQRYADDSTIIAPVWKLRYIVDYSDQLVSQFLVWANTKLVECHAIQTSFQLLLVNWLALRHQQPYCPRYQKERSQ